MQPLAGGRGLDDPVFRDVLRRHAHQCDHRRLARLGDVEQLAQARRLRVENIVGQKHRKGLVADRRARLKHGVAETQRLILIGARDTRHRGDRADQVEQIALAALLQVAFQIGDRREMVEHQ